MNNYIFMGVAIYLFSRTVPEIVKEKNKLFNKNTV